MSGFPCCKDIHKSRQKVTLIRTFLPLHTSIIHFRPSNGISWAASWICISPSQSRLILFTALDIPVTSKYSLSVPHNTIKNIICHCVCLTCQLTTRRRQSKAAKTRRPVFPYIFLLCLTTKYLILQLWPITYKTFLSFLLVLLFRKENYVESNL